MRLYFGDGSLFRSLQNTIISDRKIFMHGTSGSGKTTIIKQICRKNSWNLIEIDLTRIRKQAEINNTNILCEWSLDGRTLVLLDDVENIYYRISKKLSDLIKKSTAMIVLISSYPENVQPILKKGLRRYHWKGYSTETLEKIIDINFPDENIGNTDVIRRNKPNITKIIWDIFGSIPTGEESYLNFDAITMEVFTNKNRDRVLDLLLTRTNPKHRITMIPWLAENVTRYTKNPDIRHKNILFLSELSSRYLYDTWERIAFLISRKIIISKRIRKPRFPEWLKLRKTLNAAKKPAKKAVKKAKAKKPKRFMLTIGDLL